MKNCKNLITIALVFALVFSMGLTLAYAGTDTDSKSSGVTAWFCHLVGDQDAPTAESEAVFELTASFTIAGDLKATEEFIEKHQPYIYITKNGHLYEKAFFTFNKEKQFGVASMTIYGFGGFNGMVCCDNKDGVSIASGADGTSPSTFMLYSFDGGYSTKASYMLDGDSVKGLWEAITGMPSFIDVSPKDWFYKPVTETYKLGLVKGKTADKFAPADSVSYAEAITLASRLHASYNGTVIATEKKANEPWYQPYINYAKANNIPCTFSNYSAEVTRSDFVTIFYSALPEDNYVEINTIEDNAIPDVPMYAVSSSKIYTFYRAGILSGSSVDGSFVPYSKIKRSEVSAIVYRLLGYDRKKFSI